MPKLNEPAISLGQGAGAERIRLLEAIRSQGTITKAAKLLGVSYRTAWDGVRAMNNLFERPLVLTGPGGREGGGATITPEGEMVIRTFHQIEAGVRQDVANLQERLADDRRPLDALSFELGIKTSARNVLQCAVTGMRSGEMSTEVALDFTGAQTLTASIGNIAVDELGLSVGSSVFAIINPALLILGREGELGRTSARNRLRGSVCHRDDFTLGSEIVLDIGREKTLVATITLESAEHLDLTLGTAVVALIKASQIILISR